MPVGVHTQQERGCRAYDPCSGYKLGNKFHKDRKPLTPQEKTKKGLWLRYLDQTDELRQAMTRGSITLEQFNEATKPFRRQYAEAMSALMGFVVRLDR